MSAPQEGGCIKVFPIARALARAYNCLLLPGLGVTACLSPRDSQLATDDEERSCSFLTAVLFGRIDTTGDNTGDVYSKLECCPPAMRPCLLCIAKSLCTCIVGEVDLATPV